MERTDIEKSQNMYVVKDNDLIQKARFDFTMEEQKLVCYAISKIKPTDKEFQRYTISALDFAEITGIDKKNVYREFRKIIEGLDDKRKWVSVDGVTTDFRVFSEAEYNEKQGSITVVFHSRLKKYLLSIGTNYTKYELWNILSLKSKYSIRIYELFKSYAYQHEKEFDIDDLKSLLCAENYKSFGNLKQKVLDVGVDEINKYTDLKVKYETSKKGKGGKVSKVVFYIERKRNNDLLDAYMKTCDRINEKSGQIKGQISIFDYEAYEELANQDKPKQIGYIKMSND